MKLSTASLVLSASILKSNHAAGQVFYPDYATGSGTCLNDGNEPAYVLNSNTYETTIEACCDRFYDWTILDLCNCLEAGGGTPCTGTSEWYVDYETAKCVQDCPAGTGNCGGLATEADTLYATSLECCEGKMTSIAPGKCDADSNGLTYAGTNGYYVDYQNTKCVQDCDAAGGAPCGGIILDTTEVFADAATCCAEKLSYIDAEICAVLSDPTSTGTDKFFADSQNKMCVRDNDVCPTGETCARADASSGTLYADAASCCAGELAWVGAVFCEALTTGTPSGKWFVDYENEVCKNDCDTGDAWCVDITAMVTPPSNFYDTSLECCQQKLSWITDTTCDDLSNGLVPTGSGEWYVDYENQKCVTDCDVSAGGTCGGLATSEALFADEVTCCSTNLGFMAAGLCEANSLGTAYTGSNEYYVDYQNTKCVADCEGSPECGGIIGDSSTELFADAATCCAAKLSSVDASLCAALSDPTSTGTGMFFADVANSMCIEDADTCTGTNTCGRADASSGTLYADAAACCAGALPWVNSDYCVALTSGVPSGKWFVDYTNLVCVNDCDDGSAYCADVTALDQPPAAFYDTALACCEGKLSYTDAAQCDAVSQIGVANNAGTNKWYAATGNVCVQDCDAAGGAPCGGILALGTSTTLYDTTADCCAGQFSWFDSGLCEAMSTGTYTDKFYVGGTDKCAQDCDPAGGGACAGNPSDLSLQLFDTAEACCAAKFSYLTEDVCVSATNGVAVTGSTSFYIDWSVTKCVQDCDAAGGAPCGGSINSWNTAYASSTACCQALSWVHPDDCVLA